MYINYIKERIREVSELMQPIDSFDLFCTRMQGCFPSTVYPHLPNFLKKKFQQNMNVFYSTTYSCPEPNLADYEWRFTQQTVENLIDKLEINTPQKRTALLGTPTLFNRLNNAILYDINSLLNIDSNRTVIVDLNEQILHVKEKFDYIILDPPWYDEYYNNWLYQAINMSDVNSKIIFPLYQELLRPNAKNQRNSILNLVKTIGEIELIPNYVAYETPFFERELFAYSKIPIFENWRIADLVIVTVKQLKDYQISFKLNIPKETWNKFRIGNQTIAIKHDENVSKPIKIKYLDNDKSALLKSISREYEQRVKVNFLTSRNRALILYGQEKVEIALTQYLRNNNKNDITILNKLSDKEKSQLNTIFKIIGI